MVESKPAADPKAKTEESLTPDAIKQKAAIDKEDQKEISAFSSEPDLKKEEEEKKEEEKYVSVSCIFE